LKGGINYSASVVGCFERNQSPQLALIGTDADEPCIHFYSQNSIEAKIINPHQDFERIEVLDLDHDGVSEILGKLYGRGDDETWLSWRDGEVLKRYSLPKPWNFGGFLQVSTTGDIGYFYKAHSYVDLSTGKKMHLAYPPKQWKDKWDWGTIGYNLVSGDFLGNGELQFAVASGGLFKTAILLFNTAGECICYQDMGCEISWLTRLHANNRDYLVALAEERVFIYP
jgi:hypothetical protein